ncbi:MAG: D-alanyl-D-alanine carboxypeptidase/D-alanyl-D-alanine-endopeptidase [Bacteroidales bacterium]|nr:D-alanyl-D-alanine carboxypeptidase/D-alanyl-D-alanine-endopeptidase [Bacteroidales bacterium]
MMSKSLIQILFFLSLCIQLHGQTTEMFAKKAYKHASVGICVLDLASSKMVMNLNAQRCMEPASVVKLITTSAALEILGPDHRFETRIEYSGSIVNGILEGDLWIRGGGDPSLGSRHVDGNPEAFMEEWVQAVKLAGIRTVNGRILADATLFDDEPVSPYWLWEDLGNYYASGIFGIAVFDNSYQLTLRSGESGSQPEIVSVKPALPELKFENHLIAASNNKDSAYIHGAPYQWERSLFGTMPDNRQSFVIKGDIPDPPYYLAGYFRTALEDVGIKVNGKAVSLRSSDKKALNVTDTFKILHKTYSVPLSQMIRFIHVNSDNLYTEYLLRHLSLTASDKPASARAGLQVVKNFWKQKGLDVSALFLSDACGLSPNDRVSPELLAQILRYMSVKSKNASVFKSSFPLAGKEGSVSGFLKGTVLEGRLRLKSGSAQSVTSYAGYYEQKGKSYVVVLLVNDADANRLQIRKDMEDFLLSL